MLINLDVLKKFQKAFGKSKLARYISFAFITSLKTRDSIRLLSHNVWRQVRLSKVSRPIFFDIVSSLTLQNFSIYCFVSIGLLYISIMFHLLFFAMSALSFLFVNHRTICKFPSSTSHQYLTVSCWIAKLTQQVLGDTVFHERVGMLAVVKYYLITPSKP